MITKYYVDASGNYLGGFSGATPPDGSIEVQSPPEHGLDKWVNGKWVPNKDRLNAPILAKLRELDLKRVRPLAEGDTAYLQSLNDQITALRAQLV